MDTQDITLGGNVKGKVTETKEDKDESAEEEGQTSEENENTEGEESDGE